MFLGALVIGILLLIWNKNKILGVEHWDGNRRFTVIFDTSPLMLVSVEPGAHTASFVIIPKDTFLIVPYNYGAYKVGSVYALGELDAQKGGGPLIMDTIRDVFGLPVDGYIKPNKEKDFGNLLDDFRSFKKSYFSIGNILGILHEAMNGKVSSNLSQPEILRFFWAVHALRTDQVHPIHLENLNILKETELADRSKVFVIDSGKFDKTIEGEFNENKIREENITLSVANATGKEGIASIVARIIMNMGGRVVVVGNEEKSKERCVIYVGNKNLENSYTIKRLSEYFRCSVSTRPTTNSQSDVSILLGEKFTQ